MFTIGQTELILPTGWEYRCTRSLGLASVFCNTLINLGGGQVEYNQILIISMLSTTHPQRMRSGLNTTMSVSSLYGIEMEAR